MPLAIELNAPARRDADRLVTELESDGLTQLPEGLLSAEQLAGMQRAFAARLRRQRWNDIDGYEKTERLRHMVQDVLTLDQGFVDLALHPLIKEAVRRYVGASVALVEAKGWKTLPTRRDFHGWHGDSWYDQRQVDYIPREIKLGFYLTDVRSGAFTYVKGTHGQTAPRLYRAADVLDVPPERIAQMLGAAGTAFLFDTSGVHRQSIPVLEERQAIFLTYHDPHVPLQQEDVEYYRYHPLLLNAAFLGDLSDVDQRLLGFGDKTNYVPAHERHNRYRCFAGCMRAAFNARVFVGECWSRWWGRIKRLFGRR